MFPGGAGSTGAAEEDIYDLKSYLNQPVSKALRQIPGLEKVDEYTYSTDDEEITLATHYILTDDPEVVLIATNSSLYDVNGIVHGTFMEMAEIELAYSGFTKVTRADHPELFENIGYDGNSAWLDSGGTAVLLYASGDIVSAVILLDPEAVA